ncbi:replication-associated recombination protein A [Tepidiforma sp.]|uniref:replication-associated recombination protein A n=1 Tax=Tepidiforma sp. TaxID=2682230 RepID=UPI00262F2336|nr:replication-associated recombination protein A [Tepidiforma sp.]MCX7617113.1 replication-associated recombination protein A [Tepidiforma sp.]
MAEDALQGGFDFGDAPAAPPPPDAPLAARMRPRSLDEVIGQEAAVGPGSMLGELARRGRLPSVLLWGPPGCGKTTIARLLAAAADAAFVQLSAVTSGVADLRRVIGEAERARRAGRRTVVFIDEIHRFNRAQQDVVLPHVEEGTITLIGATTENPSFEVVAPLLSRVRVVRLQPLDEAAIRRLAGRALADAERGLGRLGLTLDGEAADLLARSVHGDARAALTALEIAADLAAARGSASIDAGDIAAALQDRRPYYDRAGDAHYDTISAFIKSVRGSDPDAALYWLARMVEAGEDPLFLARRMVILAAEDIGLADPQALVLATACQQAVHLIGMPEGAIPMAECAVYLALAPKSNSAYAALGAALEDARATAGEPVPLHLRNAATGLMAAFGYGQGYRYAHDEPGHIAAGQAYLPEALAGREYYRAGELGAEAALAARWRAAIEAARAAAGSPAPNREEDGSDGRDD